MMYADYLEKLNNSNIKKKKMKTIFTTFNIQK